MRTKALFAAIALATGASAIPLATSPAAAQPYDNMWSGAPEGLQQRIDWLQQRIDRGRADGSLSRAEADRAQRDLEMLDRDADALGRRLDDLSRNIRWARSDSYGGSRYGSRDWGTDYDAARYYRDDPRYTERRLTYNDEVYRGSDGRYYCKRNDGTTGLIVGGAGGALLGNAIDGGRHRIGGTLIGGALGALLGRSVDQNQSDYRCR